MVFLLMFSACHTLCCNRGRSSWCSSEYYYWNSVSRSAVAPQTLYLQPRTLLYIWLLCRVSHRRGCCSAAHLGSGPAKILLRLVCSAACRRVEQYFRRILQEPRHQTVDQAAKINERNAGGSSASSIKCYNNSLWEGTLLQCLCHRHQSSGLA